jgi:hypothetical protein
MEEWHARIWEGESSRVKNLVLSNLDETYIPDDIVIRVLYGGCFVEEALWMLLSALYMWRTL